MVRIAPVLVRICDRCGQTFTRSANQVARRATRFCSRDCMRAYLATHPTERPNWRGGATSLSNPEYHPAPPTVHDQRPCERCGKEFRPYTSQQRFCCAACRQPPKFVPAPMAAVTCQTCGKVFTVPESQSRKRAAGVAKYCSRPCADIGRRRAVSLTCQVCGKPFRRPPSGLQVEGNGRFCSQRCKGVWLTTAYKGRPVGPEWRAKLSIAKKGKGVKPTEYATCRQCGEPFPLRKNVSRAVRAKAKFCSYACQWAYLRLHPEKSPNWRGGYDPYYGPNWRHQAKMARERDGHMCHDCGLHRRRPKLPVHHIRPLREFARDFTAANDLSNLVTLCQTCHMRRESNYGRGLRSRRRAVTTDCSAATPPPVADAPEGR